LLATNGGYQPGRGVSVGTDGYIYVTGYTTGSLDGQTNSGINDAFISKFSPTGTKVWTKLLGSANDDFATSVSVAVDGSVYVAGYTFGSFGGQSNGGTSDAFLTKYDSNGNVIWTKFLGNSNFEDSVAVQTDRDGAVYVAGYTSGTLDGQIYAGGNHDAYLTKYLADGTKAWTKLLGTAQTDQATALSVGADGVVFVGGLTYSALDGQVYNGGEDAFLVKFAADGTKIWTREIGSSGADRINATAIGPDGSIYACGYTTGALDGQANPGNYTSFLVKYGADGSKLWTKLLGNNLYNAKAISIGPNGTISLSGMTNGWIDGQSDTSANDAFLIQYASDGTKLSTITFGTSLNDVANSIATAPDGSIYVGGYTQSALNGQSYIGGTGDGAAYLVKFQPDAISTYALTAGASAINEGATATFTLTTTNVAAGTSVPYTLSGAGITSGDIAGGQLSGSVVVDASGRATISIPIASDGIAEGSETLLVSAGGKTASILINDAGIAKTGTTGPDSLVGSVGSDTLDGGGGVDTVFYSSNQSAYTLIRGAAWTLSSSADGVDSLVNVERLHFADQSLALDVGVNQPSGQAAVLLGAVLPGKLALDPGKQALMGTVIGLFDMGYSLTDLAGALLRLDIWTILTGSNSNQARASYLLSNVNGVAPDATTLANGVNALNTEPVQGTWLAALAGGSAGQSHIGLSTLAQTGLAYIAPESITSSGQSVNEGDTVSFTVTTNLPQGTILPYTLSGTGVSSADITGGALSGTVTVNAYGQANVPVGVVADSLTEGAETLVFTSRGLTASVVINDTSVLATPTYALSAIGTSVDEGFTATFNLTTTNVAVGTAVLYTLSGVGITNSDIYGGQLSGTTVITQNGTAVILVPIAADSTTEGPETLTITLAGKTGQIVINDSSRAAATYQLFPSALAVNGGDTLVVTLKTTNLTAGTRVPYTLTVPALDIFGGALSGEFIVDANGSASVNIVTTQHQTTDILTINVFDQHQPVTLVGVKGG